MHSSIWPVTMLRPDIPPRICIFFLFWWSIPQPRARKKRQFPTPGPKGWTCPWGCLGGMVTGQTEPCITCNPHIRTSLIWLGWTSSYMFSVLKCPIPANWFLNHRFLLAGVYCTMKTGPRESWPRIKESPRHPFFVLSRNVQPPLAGETKHDNVGD